MSRRKAGFKKIHDSRKFDDFSKAVKEANRIRENVKRKAERNDYAVQLLIGISEMDGKTKETLLPHLHIMTYACPSETVAEMIVSCINDRQRRQGLESSATRHDFEDEAHIRRNIPYILRQSRKIRHYENDQKGLLNDFNIKEEGRKIDPKAFRNSSSQNTGKDLKLSGVRKFSQLPCNRTLRVEEEIASTAKGGACAESPMRNTPYSKRSRPEMAYSDLISSDEWHSYTPKEQANYYNRINMTLAHFTYKMRTSKKDIIEDFSRSNYHYNEHTNKFKTVTQSHIERWRLLLYQRRMSTKYIDCDD